MAVRNIGGIGKPKPIPVHVWIPPKFNFIYKIEVETADATYDVTNILLSGEYTDGITETIGSFNFVIDNSSEDYTNSFSLYNKVNIYMDYGASATTLKFVGLLERISKNNNRITLTGRGSAVRVLGKNVTYAATDTARSEVLTEIIEKYFDGVITTTNVSTDSTLITVNYEEKPFWEIVEELCSAAGYDAYVDVDFDFHYFESGSVLNETEMIVHDSNLIETGDFSPDLESVYNRIKVYGKDTEGIPLMSMAEDTDSQANLDGDIKELFLVDTNLTTREQVVDMANYQLAKNKNPPTVGTVISLGLPTLSPGERIRISDPMNGLEPAPYTIQKFKHVFSNDDPPKTEVTIQKKRVDIPGILKKRIKFETGSTKKVNPNEMDYSIIYDFSSDVGSHTNTVIDTEAGTLKTDGSATGTWISPTTTTSSNVVATEVRLKGNNLTNTNVYISLDGGTTYLPVAFSGAKRIVSGKDIRVKVDIRSALTEIKAVGVLYKHA